MNLYELSKLDIKDLKKIDAQKIKENFKANPEILVSVLLVLGSLVFSVYHFGSNWKNSRAETIQINLLSAKVPDVDKYKSAQADISDFLETAPKGFDEEELMQNITNWAISRQVRIESFAPVSKEEKDLYDISSIVLELSSKEYAHLWLLIHDIETSDIALWVDYCSSSKYEDTSGLRRRTRQEKQKEDESKIMVTMQVSSIKFNE